MCGILADYRELIRFQVNSFTAWKFIENSVKVNAFMFPDGEADQNFHKGGE